MIIAFVGTSSSGKTTVINRIQNSSLFKNKRLIIRKEDDFLTVKIARKILGDNIFTKYQEEKFFKRKSRGLFYYLFTKCGNFLYPLFVYLESWFEYLRYQILSRETVVLKDRYIQDYYVTLNEVLKIANPLSNFFYSIFPYPYLIFYLKIDKKTSLQRNKNNVKGKISSEPEFHERVIRAYNRLCQKDNIFTVDTKININDSLKEIKKAIGTKNKLITTRKIAIIGMDGSGKTTLANSLSEYFKRLNEKSVVVHFYHENILYKALKKLGFFDDSNLTTKKIYKKNRIHAIKNREKRTPFPVAFLRFADSLLQYTFAILIHGKSVIIFDRFFYDYLVSFEYLNISNRFFFDKLIPKIDYCIYLQTNPKVSFSRKPENTKEFFEECYRIYSAIVRKYGIKTIDSTNISNLTVLNSVIEQLT